MLKTESECVQHLTRTEIHTVVNETFVGTAIRSPKNLMTTVAFVSEERMTEMFHVRTDLVGATCFQNTLHEGDVAEAF